MLFVTVCAIIIGIIIGFALCRPIVRRRILEVEVYWKDILKSTSQYLQESHKIELNKWAAQTNYLIQKASHDRDRFWMEKFDGKIQKPKPPSN